MIAFGSLVRVWSQEPASPHRFNHSLPPAVCARDAWQLGMEKERNSDRNHRIGS
jgi:hypothetical protein